MPTSFNFNNQEIIIPGSYSDIKSGMKNPPVALPFGNVLIIDTGSDATWGGGAGVNGEFATGKDSIYKFDNIFDYRNFEKGGLHWLLAKPLFRPAGLGVNGVSTVFRIKAATTIAATLQYDFGDISTSDSNAGSFLTIKITDEGVIGNGVLNSGNLVKGYAGKITAGKIDTTAFVFTLYVGSYKGLDQNTFSFDGISQADSAPTVLAVSPECNNLSELIEWMNIDFNFNKNAKLTASNLVGSGELHISDMIFYADFNTAIGGTESYVAANLLTDALTACQDLDINFILCDNWGANGLSNKNQEIIAAATLDFKFKPEIYIAGGSDLNTFETQSINAAKSLNKDNVSLVHGGIFINSQEGLRKYDSIYHAAAVMAKEAGQQPQVPITFKTLEFDGMQHSLNDKEVIRSLRAGVLVTRLEGQTFDVVKGVNTLQKNMFLVNNDGTTHSKQIKRIARQLNKEIKVQSRADLLKDPNGVNRNTLSAIDLEAWLVKYLTSKKATPDVDNLILGFQDIVVTRQQDAYFVSYKFIPNSEISFIFFTGLIIGI